MIYQKAYRLTVELMRVSERFPRPHQFPGGLGSEIRVYALGLLQTIARCNLAPSRALHEDIDTGIEGLQVLVRMGRDLRHISIGQYEILAKQIVEIGKMNGGWMKTHPV